MMRTYIDAGFHVFGLYGAQDGRCDCGDSECQALFKHPRISDWQHTPEWSDEQLDFMESSGVFATGVGVLVKGWLIIDIDARNGGVDSFNRLCADLDVNLLHDCEFAVRTGSGGGSMHLYFNAPEGIALRQSLPDYKGIDFKSSGYVVGAGSQHNSGNLYEVAHGAPDQISNPPAGLVALLAKPETHRTTVRGSPMDVTDQQVADMLAHIPADCDYETWYKCGMAVHEATGGAGFGLWDDWSNSGRKYPGRAELERKWHSFGKAANPVTLGTLMHFAEENGYLQPVTFDYVEMTAPAIEVGDHPFSIAGVDLLRPPGFTGTIAKWIDQQCRYPREHLAVAAALTAIGNIAGMRYTDDLDGVTTNLFAFCVSASATGKEAVQQAIAELHRAAGIQGATHGSIKSEQEIIRNLIRHQAAFYVVDEIGILLTKITNAAKRGGAVYLDGVIGQLMSAYSKADSFMLLTGDTKDDVRKALLAELGQCRRAVADNEDKGGHMGRRIPQLERALNNIDNGLERPFLSLIGFTTPITFNDIVTYEQATNGFIGRSLLIVERESNPRARRGFRKQALPEPVRATLQNLYAPGTYDVQGGQRVEYYGVRSKVRTDADASSMLGSVLDWLEEYADKHKSITGLEAIVRRGYELIAKVSLILAAPEGLRTSEHVRWAYAIVRRDIDEKIRLATANIVAKDDPATALMNRITAMIDNEHGESLAVIAHRCRPRKRDEVAQAVALLEQAGKIRKAVVRSVDGRQDTEKFFAC